jgi:hypothetical protein
MQVVDQGPVGPISQRRTTGTTAADDHRHRLGGPRGGRSELSNIGGWFGSDLSASNQRPCYAASSTNTKDGGNQRNHARDALLQASSAVLGVAEDVHTEHDHTTAVILMPVVVTAAPLFAVSLADDGTPHAQRTTHEVITARFGGDDEDARQVWVVSSDWLDDLVREFSLLAEHLEYRS